MKRIFNIPATLLTLRSQVEQLTDGKQLLAKRVHWDKVCWLLDKLGNTQYFNRRTNVDSYIGLQLKRLRSICGQPYADYIMQLLLDNDIIETNGSYQVGGFSKGYRLTAEHRYARKVCVFNQDTRFLSKLEDADRGTDGERYLRSALRAELGIRYHDLLQDLGLPVSLPSYDVLNFPLESEEDLASWNAHQEALAEPLSRCTPKVQSMVQAAGRIFTRQFFSHRDAKGGRLHTNVTNLATPARKYLTLAGHADLINTDIPASQLVFACVPLLKHYGKADTPQDVIRWIALCTSPDAYERLHLEMYHETFDEAVEGKYYALNENETEARAQYRKNFKAKFFTNIYYSEARFNEGNLATKESKFMWKNYPSVMQWVIDQKADDYTAFSCNMQRAESDFIIDAFGYQAMIWMLPVVTIHDSALVPAVYGRNVMQYFQSWLDDELSINDAKVRLKADFLSDAAEVTYKNSFQLF